MSEKADIARALHEIAELLQLKGESSFKVRAYDAGAHTMERTDQDLATLIDENRLTELEGVGASLATQITELFRTGRSTLLDQLRAEMPPGFVELAQIPNLGSKKILALQAALGVSSIPALKAACEAGQVREIKGFGAKTEEKILDGIRRYEKRQQRMLLSEADQIGQRLMTHMRRSPAIWRAELAGSLRRCRETVGDLDLIVGTEDAPAVMDHFVRFDELERVESRGDKKCTARLANGVQVDLYALPQSVYWTALHHFTGSKDHHAHLRGIARDKGLTISEWGVAHLPPGPPDPLPVQSEQDLYSHLAMQYIPPEMRENEGEIEAAIAGTLPVNLISEADIKGIVHCHTGEHDTIEDLARAALKNGFGYLTITDHFSASGEAGLDAAALERQWQEIARVEDAVGIKLFRGAELGILEDGTLDAPAKILDRLDLIIASILSRPDAGEDQTTRRLIAALKNPLFKIWGHPLDRFIGERPALECRMDEVLAAAAEARVALEINGHPRRLDLEPRWARQARKKGLKFVVSAGAHSVGELRNLRYAIGTARRGWVQTSEVLNALAAAEFLSAVRPA